MLKHPLYNEATFLPKTFLQKYQAKELDRDSILMHDVYVFILFHF